MSRPRTSHHDRARQAYPPLDRWHDWRELDAKAWPERKDEKHYTLVPTTCFNCEAGCGLVAYVDQDTGEIAKIEGNPEHPASRGRNCAKGPATLNQVYDPERILYPLKRVRPPGLGPVGAHELGPGPRRHRQPHRAPPSARAGTTRSCTTSGRPGDDSYTERVLQAWGIDGHNSHTNICSSERPHRLPELDGPRPPLGRLRQRRVIFLISSHLESGHYFNPHAQRIIEAQAAGCQGHLRRPPPVQHRRQGRLLAADLAGHRALPAAGHRPPAARGRYLGARVRAPLGELGDVPRRDASTRPAPVVRVGRGRRCSDALRRVHARARPSAVRHRRPPRSARSAALIGGPSDQVRLTQLAGRRGRQPGRLADGALPVLPQRAHRLGRHRRRHQPATAGTSSIPRAADRVHPQRPGGTS